MGLLQTGPRGSPDGLHLCAIFRHFQFQQKCGLSAWFNERVKASLGLNYTGKGDLSFEINLNYDKLLNEYCGFF